MLNELVPEVERSPWTRMLWLGGLPDTVEDTEWSKFAQRLAQC
jgi:hypothetical protein